MRVKEEGSPVKPATVNTYVASVKSFLGFAHRVGYTRFNAGPLIKLKKAPRQVAQRIMGELEVRMLLGHVEATASPQQPSRTIHASRRDDDGLPQQKNAAFPMTKCGFWHYSLCSSDRLSGMSRLLVSSVMGGNCELSVANRLNIFILPPGGG
jgi:hypothetical protein